MKYLSNNRFRMYDTGMSLAGLSDTALSLMIFDAESAIDGHLGMDTKTGGFEPGVRTGQSWYDGDSRRTSPPNIYLPVQQVQGYKIQVSNLSTSGAGYFAVVNSGDVALNNFQRYLEIVPLQAVTYSAFTGVMDFGLNPPIVKVDVLQGYYLTSNSETLMDTGDGKTFVALRGFWASSYDAALSIQPATLPPIPPVVTANGVVQSSGFTINYQEGVVAFTAPPVQPVKASYTYQIPDVVSTATVKQVTYLLEQRRKRQMGLMTGMQRIRSGDQEVQAPNRPMQELVDGLCQDAAEILDKAFGMIGVG